MDIDADIIGQAQRIACQRFSLKRIDQQIVDAVCLCIGLRIRTGIAADREIIT